MSPSFGRASTPVRSQTGLGPRVYFFYCARLLYCPDQMLAVVLLSQHRVSSSNIVRPRAPCGARCMGHAIRTWSAVFSEPLHLQFGIETRPHLCMNKWNSLTPVCRRLSLAMMFRANSFQQAWHWSCGYENMKPGSILAILHVPSTICSLRSANAQFIKVL